MSLKFTSQLSFFILTVVSLLSGCTRSISDVDAAGKTKQPIFPDSSSAVRSEGALVTLDMLSLLSAGLTKAQLYDLIGAPHFKEGSFGVKEWDYIVKFRTQYGMKTCQLKVLFDKAMIAQSYYFLPADCLSTERAVADPRAMIQKIFSVETLFGFDTANLSLSGKKQISKFVSEVRPQLKSDARIQVKGYTDRLGLPKYNRTLSMRRAEAVKDYLASQGIEPSIVTAFGLGMDKPLVECSGLSKSKLISCLALNRRVVIEVIN
ncbi:OmpA family protein [Klebsiella oxytoca]|uniref:OmpA family protein n=1 Tax=Klebsiella oxytoca TaxID=571 RepID=UPI00384B397D